MRSAESKWDAPLLLELFRKSIRQGQIFACTDSSEDECFERLLFGTNRPYAPAAMRVKEGDFLFLLNLDKDILYGVFRAASDAKMYIEPQAWNGKYPFQVRVKPVGATVPIENAKKLLSKLRIKRSSPIDKSVTVRLLELYRPRNLRTDEWFEFLPKAQGTSLKISKEPRSWELLGDIKAISQEPTEELPLLKATTHWDFPKQSYGKSPKGNNRYPGVTPALLIWNLVWKYTDPGELVVDPMCGSGTTIDVCKEEGRRVIGYDIAPTRPDIIQNDSRKIPLPENHADLVFVDSPYGDNIRYNDHPDCIGKISSEKEEFYDELENVISECHRILKPGKVLGWLIGDQWVKKRFTPVGFRVYQRLSRYFETGDIICVVRRGQSSHTGLWYNRARRFNFFLRGFKYLFIMRKHDEKRLKARSRKINWTHYERNKGLKT